MGNPPWVVHIKKSIQWSSEYRMTLINFDIRSGRRHSAVSVRRFSEPYCIVIVSKTVLFRAVTLSFLVCKNK